MGNLDRLVDDFEQALLSLDRMAARNLLAKATRALGAAQVAEQLIRPALERIGAGWEQGSIALAQVYMSGRICEELVAAILPPTGEVATGQPKVAIAVLEDHHQLGSLIVSTTLRASGVALLDYGHGLKPDALAQRAVADGVEILLISALMLPSALKVKEVKRRLKELGVRVRVVVGGAPFLFDGQLWQEVGADAMGKNAAEAVDIVARLRGIPLTAASDR